MNFFSANFDVVRQLSNELGREIDDIFVLEALLFEVAEEILGENLIVDGLSALCSLLTNGIQRMRKCFHFFSPFKVQSIVDSGS